MQHYSSPLIFVRHGATDWNLESRYQGNTDTELSHLGVEQAHSNASIIKTLADTGVVDLNKITIMTSPLRRATETAAILAEALKVSSPIETEPLLRELSLGRWEGLTSQEVKDQFYEERKSRKIDRWNFKPLGGESMAGRVGDVETALLELPPHTVVVTHSVILRIIYCLMDNCSKEECAILETPHDEILLWNGVKLHRQSPNR